MALPDVKGTIQDGALGLLPSASDQIHVKLGVCSGGVVNQLVSLSEPADVVTALGQGPLARSVAHCLGSTVQDSQESPRPVLALRVNGSVAGACGPTKTTRKSTSTGTVAASGAAYDRYEVRVEILSTGTVGVGTFRYTLDGGDTWSDAITIPGGGTYVIPNTNVTLTFTPGGGPIFYELGDVFEFATTAPGFTTTDLANAVTALLADPRTWGFAHVVGPPAPASTSVSSSGTSPPVVSVSGTPADYYRVRVEITTGGARGTAVFRYSLDGGTTWAETGVTTAATYVMPGTGLTLAFATGTNYSTDNVYTFNTGNATGAATLYGAVKTHAETAEAQGRPTLWIIEAGDAPDADLIAAFAGVSSSPRVSVCAGYCEVSSPLDARLEKRNAAWPAVARLAGIPVGRDPSRRASGPLPRVTKLYRDERMTEALYAQKFTVLQTDLGSAGEFFVTAFKTFAANGSDFAEAPNRRVIDLAYATARAALKRWQSEELRVNTATGRILEADARRVENYVDARVRAAILSRPDASGLTVQTVRTDNILSTKLLRVTVRVTPLAYAKSIEFTIGFSNPALVTT